MSSRTVLLSGTPQQSNRSKPILGLKPVQQQASAIESEKIPSLLVQRCNIPEDYFSVHGLLCLKGNVQTNADGKSSINQLHLCKFYHKEVTNEKGNVYSVLHEPKWPLKLTIEEAEALQIKLGYMITAVKGINKDDTMDSTELGVARVARQHFYNDQTNQQFYNGSGDVSPIYQSGSGSGSFFDSEIDSFRRESSFGSSSSTGSERLVRSGEGNIGIGGKRRRM